MKYFRSYPWRMQLWLFVVIAFFLMWASQKIIPPLFTRITGFVISQLEGVSPDSPPALINAAVTLEGLYNLCLFLLPAFLFAYLTHPEPVAYLGLKAPGKKIQLVLVIFVMLGAMPVLQVIDGWISQLNFGPQVRSLQAENDNMMNAFLLIPTFSAFLKVFISIAIIPAFGEEMFFRGVFMRFIKKKSSKMAVPVVFSALVFAMAHMNIYGFLSIFLAGILLAVIYNITGSLWCSIVAHLFFNGLQIILAYAAYGSKAIRSFNDNTSVPYYLVFGGLIVFAISFYLLIKNKTPLPANWTDDFPPPGPVESEWDFMAKN